MERRKSIPVNIDEIIKYLNSVFNKSDNSNITLRLDISDITGELLVSSDVDKWEFVNNNSNKFVSYNIHDEIRNIGIIDGTYNISIHFEYRVLGNLDLNNVIIDTISNDRTEIKIGINSSDIDIIRKLYAEMKNFTKLESEYLNKFGLIPTAIFANNNKLNIDDWMIYYPEKVNNVAPLIIKTKSISNDYVNNMGLSITIPLIDTAYETIIVHQQEIAQNVKILSPANFSVKVNKESKSDSTYKNYNDISAASSSYNISSQLINSINDVSKDINIDYRDFNNFVTYSSITSRLSAFKTKLTEIERYSIAISNLSKSSGSVTASVEYMNNIDLYNSEIIKNINTFDGYERYLYFDSSSYESSSYGEYYPSTWPKINSTKPYTLASVTSSLANNWFDGIYQSASLFDKSNIYSIVNLLPRHIIENDYNSDFIRFTNIIGHQYDNILIYIDGNLSTLNRDNSLYEGMSKDLVYHVLKSYGWDGENSNQLDDLWYYSLASDTSGSYQSTGSYNPNNTQVYINPESIPTGDIQMELWKRILNNLPYLNKTKGTARGVEALLNIYGIPSTMMGVTEYGGPNKLDTDSYYIRDKFNYSLNMADNCKIHYISKANSNTKTIQFRFKTTNQNQPILYLNNNPNINSLFIESDGSISLYYLGSTFGNITGSFNDGNWNNVMMSVDANTTKIYINTVKGGDIIKTYYQEFTLTGQFYIAGDVIYHGATFSGELQEIREWNVELNQLDLDSHTLSPTSYFKSFSSVYQDLLQHYPLGTDLLTYNHYNTTEISSSAYTPSNILTFTGFANSNSYSSNYEQYTTAIPDLGANRKSSNKVRIEDTQRTTNILNKDRRVDNGAYDLYPIDSTKVGLYLSPTKEVDEDIADMFGGINIDDYLGGWENINDDVYSDLEYIKTLYYKKFGITNYNTYSYNRLITYFNKSLFKHVKEIVPAKSTLLSGLVIEPNILNRPKVSLHKSDPILSNNSYNGSLNLETNVSITSTYDNIVGYLTLPSVTISGSTIGVCPIGSADVYDGHSFSYDRLNLLLGENTIISNSYVITTYNTGSELILDKSFTVPSAWNFSTPPIYYTSPLKPYFDATMDGTIYTNAIVTSGSQYLCSIQTTASLYPTLITVVDGFGGNPIDLTLPPIIISGSISVYLNAAIDSSTIGLLLSSSPTEISEFSLKEMIPSNSIHWTYTSSYSDINVPNRVDYNRGLQEMVYLPIFSETMQTKERQLSGSTMIYITGSARINRGIHAGLRHAFYEGSKTASGSVNASNLSNPQGSPTVEQFTSKNQKIIVSKKNTTSGNMKIN